MLIQQYGKTIFNRETENGIKVIKKLPNGLKEINAVYGKPYVRNNMHKYDENFRQNMSIAQLPFPMRLSWNKEKTVNRILVNNLVASTIIDALQEVLDKVGYEELRRREWDLFGGVFNFRNVRENGNKLSTHSWGIAIDLNPHLGPLGEAPRRYPEVFTNAFKKRGALWGGDFKRPDGMHFQFCKGY